VSEYHHNVHPVWDIKYYLVWITKYRYNVLRSEVAERARDLRREICASREGRIVRGRCRRTHIHMLVVAPPQLAPAKLVQFLKRRSSRMRVVDEQTVMAYIESQKWDQDDEGFKVVGPTEP
jgi:putative transposase